MYLNLKSNPFMSELYFTNATKLGVTEIAMEAEGTASTDMGNVSHIVPSIHPFYAIGSGEVNHTREFTAVANTRTQLL